MKKFHGKIRFWLHLVAVGGCVWASQTEGQTAVRLPSLISDHMVLQQGEPVKIWGWAEAGEKVTVRFAGQNKETEAGQDGKWSVTLDALPAGEPQVLTVQGTNEITIKDVLVGEVWLCAGQSNMEWPVAKTTEAAEVLQKADQPQIRVFSAANTPAHDPMDDVAGKWVVSTPSTAGAFPAVAYEFGTEIHQALKAPVGLITASIGGTPAESWASIETFAKLPDLKKVADAQILEMGSFEDNKKRFLSDLAVWEKDFGGDKAAEQLSEDQHSPKAGAEGWTEKSLPVSWKDIGLSSGGAVWFTKRFDLEAGAVTREFLINAGNVSYGVRAFLNGKELAQVNGAQPMYCLTPRLFVVPANLAKSRDNVLALRIFTHTGRGQYGYSLADMWFPITAADPKNAWNTQVEFMLPEIAEAAKDRLPVSPSPAPQQTATYNFNGLIHPLISYGLRGVVWYQGESNVERADDYARLFSGIIADWRQKWGQPKMPFYFVQLPNFGGWPTVNTWAKLREAQQQVANSTEDTGMTVAIDLGEAQDIHPKSKTEVARRLSLLALKRTYGKAVHDAPPILQSSRAEGNKMRLSFGQATVVARDGAPRQIFIAGEDRKFVMANAEIEGNDIVVSSPLVKNPVAVRYAWSNNPVGCNLYDSEGLPIAPFRTDNW